MPVKKPAARVAKGAILAALLTAGLLLTRILPTGKVALLAVLSLLPGILLRQGERSAAAVACLASVLLGWILGTELGILASYGFFFAWYAFFWTATERKRFGMLLRVLCGQVGFLLIAGAVELLGFHFSPIWPYLLGAEAFLVLFDFCYSLCVQYYDRRLAKYIK